VAAVCGWKLYTRTQQTERQKEADLRIAIQKELPEYKDKIILSRVCKYNKHIPGPAARESSLMDIQGELQSTYYGTYYPPSPENSHINHFYLIVSLLENVVPPQQMTGFAFDRLQILPGDWRFVTPPGVWPQTFIGVFPKTLIQETERAREWRLNIQVRLPLKHLIDAELKRLQLHIQGHVLLTRACI